MKNTFYDVVYFRRHGQNRNDCVVIASGLPTLNSAKEARQQSGDIVVHAGTGRVVLSREWLWDWEKADLHSFAQQMLRQGIRVNQYLPDMPRWVKPRMREDDFSGYKRW